MREDILLGDAEFEVEDVEELALYPADVALAEDARAQRPMHVLQCRVVGVLDEVMIISTDRLQKQEVDEHTLFATMRAPRKTRSQAHCSSAIWRWGFARSMYARVTRRAGTLISALWITSATKLVNFACSECRESERPRDDDEGRPKA